MGQSADGVDVDEDRLVTPSVVDGEVQPARRASPEPPGVRIGDAIPTKLTEFMLSF